MKPALKVDITEVKSKIDNSVLLRNQKFDLEGPGIVWIYGENGSGKSILASIISGKAYFPGSRISVKGGVEISIRGGNTFVLRDPIEANEYSKNVAYWPQRLGESLISIHHQDDLCSGFEARLNRNRNKLESFFQELQRLMEELNLTQHLTKETGSSSYGETRRIELAVNLTSDATIIVADEPFSGLDTHWKEVLCRTIKLYVKLFNVIWVITSHLHPENYGIDVNTIVNLSADDTETEIYEHISNEAVKLISNANIKKDYSIVARDISIIRRNKRNEKKVLLRNFNAPSGKVSCIWGGNGSGKTSISHLLGGILSKKMLSNKTKYAGQIEGEPFNGSFIKAPNDEVRIILQNPYISFIRKYVEEDILRPQCPGNYRPVNKGITEEFLLLLQNKLGNLKRNVLSFSFGQLRFLQFLLIPPTAGIIIFDEPFLGLHKNLYSIVGDFMEELADTGRTIIYTAEYQSELNFSDNTFFLGGTD